MIENRIENEDPDIKDPQRSPPTIAKRPDFLPLKFWDREKGEVLVENMARSYVEMEKRFSRKTSGLDPVENTVSKVETLQNLDIPKSGDEYKIDIAAEFLRNDSHINKLLHAANFTQAQAQLVYDLAAVEMMPLVQNVSDHFEAATANARLENHFGGREKWREISRQIRKWGENHLPTDAYEALSASVDGILAMHKMMGQGDEPSMLTGSTPSDGPTEDGLRKLMSDPRYWRDRDPAIVARVTEGFKRIYPS